MTTSDETSEVGRDGLVFHSHACPSCPGVTICASTDCDGPMVCDKCTIATLRAGLVYAAGLEKQLAERDRTIGLYRGRVEGFLLVWASEFGADGSANACVNAQVELLRAALSEGAVSDAELFHFDPDALSEPGEGGDR